MKLKKCLLTFLIGFSLLFSSVLTSCGDTPKANEDELEQPDSEKETEKESEKESEKDKESEPEEAAQEKEYTVTFNVDGGSAVTAQTIKDGAKATKPATNPTKEGYEFEGWFSDTAKTTAFDFNTAIKADTTIYAKWKTAAGYVLVTFNTNGGSTITEASVKEGEKVTKPADPTKNYCVFLGWYSDSAFTTEFNFNTAITAATTIYAKWKVQGKIEMSLIQDTVDGLAKSTTGYTFTAPEGFADYEWKLLGNEIGECDLTPDTDNPNICTISLEYWDQYLVVNENYTVEVAAKDASNNLQDVFYCEFTYEGAE